MIASADPPQRPFPQPTVRRRSHCPEVSLPWNFGTDEKPATQKVKSTIAKLDQTKMYTLEQADSYYPLNNRRTTHFDKDFLAREIPTGFADEGPIDFFTIMHTLLAAIGPFPIRDIHWEYIQESVRYFFQQRN